ncbi:predicted protein [Naegleria gruberi]|uniref:Predicted protein n=1 Tax=Naegleria gruberi TaxID=5762 RepID=D2VML1_NAEGR|nr:uncharacterized protein NAEGRDRAFT_58683 [Naegleria gruberi]EFC42085.1 predicted protein [Naegleria gruberi]|eukprot:XP_002674829.1 predicted protein [Naegleria gruberi strain NEG-M]
MMKRTTHHLEEGGSSTAQPYELEDLTSTSDNVKSASSHDSKHQNIDITPTTPIPDANSIQSPTKKDQSLTSHVIDKSFSKSVNKTNQEIDNTYQLKKKALRKSLGLQIGLTICFFIQLLGLAFLPGATGWQFSLLFYHCFSNIAILGFLIIQLVLISPLREVQRLFKTPSNLKEKVGKKVNSSFRNIIGNESDSNCVKQFWIDKLKSSNWLLKMISLNSKPQTLIKKCQLLNQWENDDCIKYWTSNYSVSNGDRSNKVFRSVSIEMNESGVVMFKSLVKNDDLSFDICKSTYIDVVRMIDIQNRLCKVHAPLKEQHRMTWKDPSANSSVNSPLIPFIIPMTSDTSSSNIFTDLSNFLGVNPALIENKDRYMNKSIQISQSDIQTSVNNHPLTNTNDLTINFQSIFPKEQFNTEFTTEIEQFIRNEIENPTLIMIGLSQLNPIPIFIIGKSKSSIVGKSFNYVGFMTSSFRVPEFVE